MTSTINCPEQENVRECTAMYRSEQNESFNCYDCVNQTPTCIFALGGDDFWAFSARKIKYNELGEIYLREESITFCVGVIIGIYTKFFPLALHNPIVGVYFTALYRALASSRTRLLDHTQRRATVGRIPLNE